MIPKPPTSDSPSTPPSPLPPPLPSPSQSPLPPSLQTAPFLRTSATLSPHPPLTFTTVIEDDHSRINAAAIKFGRSLSHSLNPSLNQSSPHQTRQHLRHLRATQLTLLRDLTCLLIRHDVSEDLILRPAFIHYLGREGEEISLHDRREHDVARAELLGLYEGLEVLPLPTESASAADRDRNRDSERDVQQEFMALVKRFRDLMGDLAEHMRVESGMQIPRLEGAVGREESEVLARRYVRTYVLEPGLRVDGERVWRGGVGEYVRCKREVFVRVWERLEGRRGEGKL